MTPAKLYNALIFFGQGAFIAYDVVYFGVYGLSLATISLLSTCFNISGFLAELPFAIFFDRKSPKMALFIGNAFRACGFILFICTPNSFILVAIGQILAGIGSASESGAISAIYINEQTEKTKSNTLKKLNELSATIGLSCILGCALSTFLYAISPKFIWVVPTISYLLASITLVKVHTRETGNIYNNHTLTKETLNTFKQATRSINFWNVICIDTSTIGLVFLWQIVIPAENLDHWGNFLGLAFMNLGSAIGGLIFSRFALTRKRTLLALILSTGFIFGITAISANWLTYAFFFMHVLLQLGVRNWFSSELHKQIADNQRATVFSFAEAVFTLVSVVGIPLVGWFSNQFGTEIGIFISLPALIVPLISLVIRKQN